MLGFTTESRESSLLPRDMVRANHYSSPYNKSDSKFSHFRGHFIFKGGSQKCPVLLLLKAASTHTEAGRGEELTSLPVPFPPSAGQSQWSKKPEQAPHGCCCPGPPCFSVISHLSSLFLVSIKKMFRGQLGTVFLFLHLIIFLFLIVPEIIKISLNLSSLFICYI